MPALSELQKMIGLDAENEEDRRLIIKYTKELEDKAKTLPDKIRSLVKGYNGAFKQRFSDNLDSVNGFLNELDQKVPTEIKETIVNQVEDTNKAITNPYANDDYGGWFRRR